MKKGKTIFLIIYLLFHLILLVSAIVVNLRSEDFEFLFSVRDNMSMTVWFAIIGMILFVINVVMITSSTSHHTKKEEGLRQEINSLKAKMYDLQDARKTSASPTTRTNPTTPAKPEKTEPTKPDDNK